MGEHLVGWFSGLAIDHVNEAAELALKLPLLGRVPFSLGVTGGAHLLQFAPMPSLLLDKLRSGARQLTLVVDVSSRHARPRYFATEMSLFSVIASMQEAEDDDHWMRKLVGCNVVPVQAFAADASRSRVESRCACWNPKARP